MEYASLGKRSVLTLNPYQIVALGRTGPRTPPIIAGPTSVRLEDMILPRFSAEYRDLRVRHIILDGGSVISGHGSDGVIFDENNNVVEETARFSHLRNVGAVSALDRFDQTGPIGVFFDSAWANYYHLIVFSLARVLNFGDLIGSETPILMPSIANAFSRGEVGIERSVFNRLMEIGIGERRSISLPDGIHHFEKIHLFWGECPQPANIVESEDFLSSFSNGPWNALGDCNDERSAGIFIRRLRGDPRMDPDDIALAESLASDLGFKTVVLETMSADAQASLFRNAPVIISPHGAGLSNIVFCRKNAVVVELNRRIGVEHVLRPWFYQLSTELGLDYAAFDLDKGQSAVSDAFKFARTRLAI